VEVQGGWRYGADGIGDCAEVALEDFGKERVEIDEVVAEGSGGHAHRDGEVVEGDVVAAVAGEEVTGHEKDTVLLFAFAGAAFAAVPGEGIGFGAEGSERDGHRGGK
jgi:hypothetical protein